MNIRNMGDIAFIILRKRDGVLQTVFEKGVTKAELSQLKEETFVEGDRICGTRGEERLMAWASIDRREDSLAAGSAVPIAVSKWKMGASLEARLDMRPLTLRM